MKQIINQLRMIFPKWVVKRKTIGGEEAWVIYNSWLGFDTFFERWNSDESAKIRLKELTK